MSNLDFNKRIFRRRKNLGAFTIIELLVVIVVIGILAAITIVSYSGIQNKAIVAGLQADLDNNSKLLRLYNVDHGYYPSALDANNCPSAPEADSRYCLKSMNGTTLTYTGGNQTFKLIDTHTATNISWQIDDGGALIAFVPGPWKSVTTGFYHTCAIAYSNSQAYCWGSGTSGQLGNNSLSSSSVPIAVLQGDMPSLTVKGISAGKAHTCAIASNDQVYCWGWNQYGQIGDSSTNNRLVPAAVAQGVRSSLTARQVVAGGAQTCVISLTDTLYCWGNNTFGGVGDGSGSHQYAPAAVLSGAMPSTSVKSVAVEEFHTCAIAINNQAYCWGYNATGQLGDGTTTTRSSPVAVIQGAMPSLLMENISVGDRYTCAINQNKQMYCWGWNTQGNLGDDTFDDRTSPVAVLQGDRPTLTVKAIATNQYHVCAISSNDRLYCWGWNAGGQLGDGTTTRRTIPTAVLQGAMPSLVVKSVVSDAYGFTCAIASDDKVYCWGYNDYGQLGDNTLVNKSLPVQSLLP